MFFFGKMVLPSFGPPTHRRSLGDQEDVPPCSENGLHDFLAFEWLDDRGDTLMDRTFRTRVMLCPTNIR